MATGLFTAPWQQTIAGGSPRLNLTSTTLKLAIYPSTITPNFEDSLGNCAYGAGVFSGTEVSGSGYSAGGIGPETGTCVNSPAGTLAFQLPNPLTLSSVAFANGRFGLIYDTSLSDTGLILLDFGVTVAPTGGMLTITFASAGVFTLTVHP